MEKLRVNNVDIIKGDCLKGMRMLDANSIDLTITSPPYDSLRRYKGFKWDFENIAKELYRVTKLGGIVVWVVSDQTKNWSESCSSFKQALFFKDIGFNLHDTMIWEKNNPMPQRNWKRYTNSFEYMFVFSKGVPKTCNLLTEECKCKGVKHGKNSFKNSGEGKRITKNTKVKNYKVRNNIWKYSVSQFKGHPATFPEKLAEEHILSWSNEGDVIMDIFMGSGTVGKMALKNNRKFLGFEISEEYVEISYNRIKSYIMNNKNI